MRSAAERREDVAARDRPIGIRCMHRDDVLPIEPQALEVRDEDLRADDGRIRHWRLARRHGR